MVKKLTSKKRREIVFLSGIMFGASLITSALPTTPIVSAIIVGIIGGVISLLWVK